MAKINGNEPFMTTTKSFTVGKTSSGYTLAYGVDKNNLTAYSQATPANEDLIVNGATPLTYFMLSGCTDTNITVIFHS